MMFRLLVVVLMMSLSGEEGFGEENRANSVMEGYRLFADDQPSTRSITDGIYSGLIPGLAYSMSL